MSKYIHIVLVILICFHLFFRFFQLEERVSLGWDQIDSAWAAKSIVVDRTLLVRGPVAKGNTGIYMGPLYYYFISIFYFFTGMDPIASPIFGAVTATINAIVLYWVTKKLFGVNVALIALFINTFSINIIYRDHIQNAIQYITPVSYLIFYVLFRVITGSYRHLLHLGILLGISFHVDFTSVFYPMLVVCALPFFPKTKKALPFYLGAITLFALLVSPIFLAGKQTSLTANFGALFQTYYHGFHFQRIAQLAYDAFISLENILQERIFRQFVFFITPAFMFVYWKHKKGRDTLRLFYLITLWFIIPWFVLSTYKGELTTSYFSLPYNTSIAMLSFLTWQILQARYVVVRAIPILWWIWYAVANSTTFLYSVNGTMPQQRQDVLDAITKKEVIPFKDGHADSYFYYYYTTLRNRK